MPLSRVPARAHWCRGECGFLCVCASGSQGPSPRFPRVQGRTCATRQPPPRQARALPLVPARCLLSPGPARSPPTRIAVVPLGGVHGRKVGLRPGGEGTIGTSKVDSIVHGVGEGGPIACERLSPGRPSGGVGGVGGIGAGAFCSRGGLQEREAQGMRCVSASLESDLNGSRLAQQRPGRQLAKSAPQPHQTAGRRRQLTCSCSSRPPLEGAASSSVAARRASRRLLVGRAMM